MPLESQGVQAWDRYAYVNNNPVKYNDPSGHFAIPVVAAAILFHPVTALLVSAIILTTAHNVLPGLEERTAALAQVFDQAQTAINGIFTHPTMSNPELANAVSTSSQQINTAETNALLMKGEYVPPILDGYKRALERKLYGKALEAYKDAHGLAPDTNVPKDICDGIAKDILAGKKPEDAADRAPEPPDGGYPTKGKPKGKSNLPKPE